MIAIFPCLARQITYDKAITATSTKAARLAVALAAGLLAFASLPGMARAGGHATLEMGSNGTQLRIEWRDPATVRLNMASVSGSTIYFLLRAGKYYMIRNGTVMPQLALPGMFLKRAGAAAQPTLVGPTGSETIAGIRGDVYRLNWPSATKGRGRAKDIVLSDNPLVIEMTKAWIANAAGMPNSQMRDSKALSEIYQNKGALRIGKFFLVVSIDGVMPPTSDFVVPTAKAVGMAANGQGFGQKSGVLGMIQRMEQQSGNSAPGSSAANAMIGKYIKRLLGN